jgi:hypothetical protein
MTCMSLFLSTPTPLRLDLRRRLIRAVERYQLTEIPEVLALCFEIIRRFWIVCLRRRRVEMLDHCVDQSASERADYDNEQDDDLANSHHDAGHTSNLSDPLRAAQC